MPIRMLRDWTDSEAVNALKPSAEVLFVRLIMKADDYGRFTANPKLIRSLCYPLQDGLRESDIARDLAACEEAGLIATYTAAGKPFLEIAKFDQRLRAKRSKYPAPSHDGDLRADGRHMTDTCQSYDGLNGIEAETRMEHEAENETEADGSETEKQTEKPVMTFPVEGREREWNLYPSKLAEYQDSFPSLDIMAEFRAALQWIRDNPGMRKTFSGMPRFLTNWLTKSQNDGRGRAAPKKPVSKSLSSDELEEYNRDPEGCRRKWGIT